MPVTAPPFPAGETSEERVAGGTTGAALPSLRRNSAARFLSDASALVFGMVAGVITARWLGTAGKGLFSSLTFIAGLVMQVCSVGLGDAATVLVGQKKATIDQAASATVTAGLIGAGIGTALVWFASLIAFQQDWSDMRAPTLIASASIPVSLLAYHLTFVLNAQERIVASSTVMALTSAMTAVGLWLFVAVLDLSIAGATLGSLLGAAAGLGLVIPLLKQSGISLRPRWDKAYLAAALRYGVAVEASYLLTVMFLRVDLLLVYGLAGAGPAGIYSVALTLGALVGLLPIAISSATFPRLAGLEEPDANELTAQICRFGVATAVMVTALLAVTVPVALPFVFGDEFAPAVTPTLVLAVGGVSWSTLWILCRAWAARGRPGLLVRCFGLSLLLMTLGDVLLIPSFGITGAAIAAVIAPTTALVLCLVVYARSEHWPLPLTRFLPRPRDFREFITQALQLLSPRKSPSAP